MKNKTTLLIVIAALVGIAGGCSWITGNKNSKSGANANTEQIAKTGVKECDEFIDVLSNDQKAPDEGFIQQKAREFIIDIAKESIKKNIEENKGDKDKIALGCKEAKEKYLSDRADQKKEKK